MFDTFDARRGQGCRPVLMILDEAGTVGFPSLPEYAATAAGRGISLWLAIQDLSQLENLYKAHNARTIRNSMGAKVFYQQDDPDTAKHISETLGYRSGYSHSETLREGEVASQGRSETAVHVFTQREAMEQGLDDVIFTYKNLKPGRGKRVEPWRYPLLEKRRRMTPPRLVMVSFTYMRSEADLTLYVPTQRVAIVVWTKLCVLDDAASADDRRPRLLGGSGGSGCAAGRQSG